MANARHFLWWIPLPDTIIVDVHAKMAWQLTLGVNSILQETANSNVNCDIYWADDFLYILKIAIAYMK